MLYKAGRTWHIICYLRRRWFEGSSTGLNLRVVFHHVYCVCARRLDRAQEWGNLIFWSDENRLSWNFASVTCVATSELPDRLGLGTAPNRFDIIAQLRLGRVKEFSESSDFFSNFNCFIKLQVLLHFWGVMVHPRRKGSSLMNLTASTLPYLWIMKEHCRYFKILFFHVLIASYWK